jgi:hypothetical protein
MIVRLAACLLTAAVLAGDAPAEAWTRSPVQVAGFDRTGALQAPVEDLANRTFAAAAARFVEVTRPDFEGAFSPPGNSPALAFATTPRSAGSPGLCEATTAWVDPYSGSTPISTRTVYKVVGDLNPLPDMWNDAYAARLERDCAAAGRVIPRLSSGFGELRFFRITDIGGFQTWQTAWSLQKAVAAARAGAPVSCTQDPPLDPVFLQDLAADDPERVEDRENRRGCANPRAIVSRLTLDRLLTIDVAPCPGAARDLYCVSADFLRRAEFNRQILWTLKLQYRTIQREQIEVGSIVLQPGYAIYD